MKIAIYGLGYVGAVSAACFAKLGQDIIGYDSNPKKVDKIRGGEPPVKEPELRELLEEVVLRTKKLGVTDSFNFAVKNSDISFVCVGTPISLDGLLETKYLERVCDFLAESLKNLNIPDKKHIIVIRSSVVPGTMEKLKKIFLDKGLIYGRDFVLANNPELMREGSAVKDFMNPPHIIIGAEEKETAETIGSIYKGINAPIFTASIKTVELIKLVDNAWHTIKLSFANEVASICKKEGIDTKELINLFCSDDILNISKYYLERPSIGFGGSCLPKDLVALERKANELGLNCVLLKSVLKSNIEQIRRALNIVKEEAQKLKTNKIGFYGVAFKPGTDDIRGSPIIYLINNLKLNGYDIKIFDPIIKREQIENIRASYRTTINDPLMNTLLQIENFKDILPIIESNLFSEEWVLDSDIIVMNTAIPLESLLKLRENQVLIDMQGVTPMEDIKKSMAKYVSIVNPELK